MRLRLGWARPHTLPVPCRGAGGAGHLPVESFEVLTATTQYWPKPTRQPGPVRVLRKSAGPTCSRCSKRTGCHVVVHSQPRPARRAGGVLARLLACWCVRTAGWVWAGHAAAGWLATGRCIACSDVSLSTSAVLHHFVHLKHAE